MTALYLGVGARRGTTADEILALAGRTLAEAGDGTGTVAALATVEAKADEPAVLAAAERLGVPLRLYSPDELAAQATPHPSQTVLSAAGTPAVAEAAALLAAGPGGVLLVGKRKSARATCAVAVAAPRTVSSKAPMHEPDLRHHGDAEVRGAGAELTDLAVNVRSGTPPQWLRERIADSLTGLAAYPDGRAARRAVAARHGLPEERVLLTAGAAEAFVLLARALVVRRAVVVHPQFTEPEAALRDAGHAVERVVLDAADGFRLDPRAVPGDADLVVVGNPTNPTSVLHPASALARLARPGRTLVVDEAFMDAVPGERESLAARTDLPGLVVLRSLTKTWGLAGLRIGYVLAAPDTVAALERAQPLWPVSSPALVAAEACCLPAAVAESGRTACEVAADRAYLEARLTEFPTVAVCGPAAGPFLLLRLPDASAVRNRLRGLGFAVRRGDTFPGLGPEYLRVAVRDRETSDRFAEALALALAKG